MPDTKRIYLSLIASALLILGWPPFPSSFLLFIGFVPLLFIHHQLKDAKKKHLKFFGWTYLVIFLFNVGSTWWVWNASHSGCVMMLFANSLIMSMPFLLFSWTGSRFPKLAYLSLPVYYLTMEYIHFNWNASWPWLTLGKGLAVYPWYIQWYEFTGEMGGTALIVSLNIWVFRIILNERYKRLWQPAAALLFVCGISLLTGDIADLHLNRLAKNKALIECVIAQPNIDPYEEKFGDGVKVMSAHDQLARALDIALPLISAKTQLLVLPETAIVGWNEESRLNELSLITPLKQLTDRTGLVVLSGAETFSVYNSKEKPTITARFDFYDKIWWDSYNTALLIANNKVENIYHKSKLVPGVEKMPFEFLEKLSINLGGTSGSLGVSKKPVNFKVNDQLTLAPLICYESVFGDYTNEFVRDGATALAVITNDGWWGNTPGFEQHLLFGAIRAIETRKEIVRSANTGVSAKINIFGDIIMRTKYDECTAFRCTLSPNNYKTFYVRHGNLIGLFSCYLAGVLILMSILKYLIGKRQNRVL